MSKTRLTQLDFCRTAKNIGCEVEAIQAVAKVESGGRGGFDETGRLLLRFEGHHFRKYTNGKYDRSHPHLSYPYAAQKEKPHGYSAFNEAFALAPVAAMLACSYGMFQVLGSHYDDLGFETVGEFVNFLKRGEAEQLEIFVSFCRVNGLLDELRRLDFTGFARVYNGAYYRDFDYDGQMRGYYKNLKTKNIDCSQLIAQIERAENIRLTETKQSSAAATASNSPSKTGTEGEPETPAVIDSPATGDRPGTKKAAAELNEPETPFAENSAAPAAAAPRQEICKERPSTFVRIGAGAMAGVGAVTSLGVNIGSLIQNKFEQLTLPQIFYAALGLAFVALAIWFYDRSAKRANALNQTKLSIAANPALITTELNANYKPYQWIEAADALPVERAPLSITACDKK